MPSQKVQERLALQQQLETLARGRDRQPQQGAAEEGQRFVVGIAGGGLLTGDALVHAGLVELLRAGPVVCQVRRQRGALVGVTVLQEPGITGMQLHPGAVGHALVGGFQRDEVLEQVAQLGLGRLHGREAQAVEFAQRGLHGFGLAERGVVARQVHRAQHAADDAGHLQSQLLRRAQLVDAAEHQAVQAGRQLQGLHGSGIARVDAAVMQVVQQFFQVEGVALRAGSQAFDQRRWHRIHAFREQRCELGADHLLGLRRAQTVQLDLPAVGQRHEGRHRVRRTWLRRPPTQYQQHWPRRQRARHPYQQVPRQRIGGVQVFQHQHQRYAIGCGFARGRFQAAQQHRFKQGLAVLGLQAAREVVVGPVQAQRGAQQRPSLGMFRHTLPQFGLDGTDLPALRQGQVEVEEGRPDRPPDQIGRLHPVQLAGTRVAQCAAAPRQPRGFGHQARFAHAGFGRDAQHPALSELGRGKVTSDQRDLGFTAHHRQVGRWFLQPDGTLLLEAAHGEHRHRLGLASHRDRGASFEAEFARHHATQAAGDEDLSRLRLAHQARGGVHVVADGAEGLARGAAVTADPHGAAAQPHVHRAACGGYQLSHGQRRAQCAGRIVFVHPRCTEAAVQAAALLGERQLQHLAAVPLHDALRPGHQPPQVLDGLLAVVDVQARKAQEQRARRAQVGREQRLARRDAVEDKGQHPRPERFEFHCSSRRQPRRSRSRVAVRRQRVQDHKALARRSHARRIQAQAQAQGHRRGLIDQHLAGLCQSLGRGDAGEGLTGQHIDELDLGIAHSEAARRTAGQRHLHR